MDTHGPPHQLTTWLESEGPVMNRGGDATIRPVGVQQRRGVALPANTRSVARPSRYGNPFRCAPTPSGRAEAVERYRAWLASQPELIDAARRQLAGYNLACYCPLDDPCHRNVLLELANPPARPGDRLEPKEQRWSR